MTDLFQTLADAPDHVLQMIGTSLEGRAKDPAQKAILESYIQDLTIDKGAVVVELGCGTGPVCRRFAEIGNVDRVIGIEPAAKALIGSQDVPYIWEDRVSKEDFIDALTNTFF